MMKGNAEKVPILTPRSAKYFYTILSHGYVLTGLFALLHLFSWALSTIKVLHLMIYYFNRS